MLKNRRITAIILAIIMTFTFTGQVSVFGLGNGETSQAQEEQASTQPADGAGGTGSTEATETTETTGTDNQEMTTQAEETPDAGALAAGDENVIYQAANLKEAAASGSATWDGKTIDISWYDPSKKSFTISTAAEFAGLAALVNGSYDKTITGIDTGNDTAKRNYIKCVKIENFMFVGAGGGNQGGTCYKATGENDFMGKTIKVTADLDMTAGNYMPIGGKYPMCDAKGSMYVNNEVGTGDAHVIEAYFNGILDCGGHTISISCDRYTKSGFPYSMAAGLVGYIGEVIDSDEVDAYKGSYTFKEQSMQTDWAPAVRNVSLKGSVYARRMVGGVVGRVGSSGDSNLGVFVENCANHASVKSTDAKGAGGVVGAGWGTGKIINCYNTGDIESSYGTCPVGGICAENGGMDIYNCYNTGTMSGNSYGRGIGSHDFGSYTINNCYSLQDTNSDSKNPIWYSGTATDIEIKDAETKSKTDMQSPSFVALLNSGNGDDNYAGGAYVSDDNSVNSGYPVLYFEKAATTSSCTVTIPAVDNGTFKCFCDGGFAAEGSTITVPYGSVIKLYATPDSGYILKNYTAAGSDNTAGDLIGDFVTVTENLTVNADIVKLKDGTIKIKSGTDCTVVATKKGLVKDGTDVKTVKRQKVVNNDTVYQLDVVTVSAYLDENAVPKDPDLEYSGEFEYTYKYEDKAGNELKDSNGKAIGGTSTSGKVIVDENINGAVIVISAEPMTQEKTWLSFADTSWYDDYDGEGSYEIDSAEDLAGLAYLVNIEGETFSGETIEIPENTVISLKNIDGRGGTMRWPGIGISSNYNYFAGTFIGNDCTIMDMKRIDKEGSDGGLFNNCSGATIKGIRLRGDTKVLSNGGGIVGSADSCTIENCINYTDVTNQDEKGECAGGIAGRAVGSTINNCINRGDICGYSYVGGIAGNCYAEISNIKNCSNYGVVKTLLYDTCASGDSALGVNGTGGICGRAYANIDQCANFGKIYSTDRCTGGIVGKLDSIVSSTAYVLITNSYNNGDIVTKGKIENISDNAGGAGGIVGYAYKIVIQNAYNSGTVTRLDSDAAINNTCVYGVGYFGCGLPTNVNNCYTIDTGVDSWGHTKTPSTVKIAEKTAADMKTEAFAKTLGSLFESAGGDYPTLTRFSAADSIEKICTVTFTNDSPSAFAGNSFDINYGGSISLDAFPADNWKKYVFTVDGNPWDGKNITKNITVKVAEENVGSYNAIFKAAGQIKATVPYVSGDTYNALSGKPDSSAIPAKDGFAAAWPDDVTLNQSGDTIINAVYYPDGSKLKDVQTELIIAKNDDDSVSTYYLGGKSTGTITIDEGAKVKLIGDSGVCEELNIVMKKNSTLTASNLQLLCDAGTDLNDHPTSVLTMNEGCTLDLNGSKNYIEGADTDSKVCVPAIKVLGDDCVIESTDGGGVLTATAETGDPVIDIADGKTLTFKSGIMKLHKSSKIGSFDGGVINSGRDTVKGTKGTANFTMTGGTLYCTANSDHMHAVKVSKFTMTAGDALIASNDENKALVADSMDIEGGDLHVYSADYDEKESVKTEENRTYYYNKDAMDYTTFTNSKVNKVLFSGMTAPYDVYKMPASASTYSNNSKFACRGLKYKYDVDKDKLVKAADNCLYVWTTDSQTAKAVPAGTDMSNDDNVRGYTAATENNNVKVTMKGTAGYRRGWYKACATYDKDGNMLEFNCNKISDDASIEMKTLNSTDYYSLQVFILKDIGSLVPELEKYEKKAN